MTPTWEESTTLSAIRFEFAEGTGIELVAGDDGTAVLRRANLPDRILPLSRRPIGEELAEELRRLDEDEVYAATARRLAKDARSTR